MRVPSYGAEEHMRLAPTLIRIGVGLALVALVTSGCGRPKAVTENVVRKPGLAQLERM
jgi:hypothetical protein